MGLALYLLKLEFIEAANRLQDLDLDAQTIIDTLDSMGGDIEEKSHQYRHGVSQLKSHCSGY